MPNFNKAVVMQHISTCSLDYCKELEIFLSCIKEESLLFVGWNEANILNCQTQNISLVFFDLFGLRRTIIFKCTAKYFLRILTGVLEICQFKLSRSKPQMNIIAIIYLFEEGRNYFI